MTPIIDIPIDLRFPDRKLYDVTILVGNNGSGKSQLLEHLCNFYLSQGRRVIAVANSIYDRFPNKKRNLHLLRDRTGREKTRIVIKNAILNVAAEDNKRLRNLSEALTIVGYSPMIGIQRIRITTKMLDDALKNAESKSSSSGNTGQNNFLDYEREDLEFYQGNNRLSVIDRYDLRELRALLLQMDSLGTESIIWMEISSYSFEKLYRSSLIQILKFEKLLKKLGLVRNIDIYLQKKGDTIKLFEASSGELSFIATLMYISSSIDDNTAILIDEPENSLHPTWQKKYCRILFDLFYLFQPKIVAATHSALILTGSEVSFPSTQVYNCESFKYTRQQSEPLNIEKTMIDVFKVVTPENRYLSTLLVDMFNNYAEKKLTLSDFKRDIDNLIAESFDEQQQEVLERAKELAERIPQ